MRILNKVLKDSATLTYTYTCVCKHCGFTKDVDKVEKKEIEISQLPCEVCQKPIPQVVMPTPEPVVNIGLRTPDVIEKKSPVKKVKPHKKNRKNK